MAGCEICTLYFKIPPIFIAVIFTIAVTPTAMVLVSDAYFLPIFFSPFYRNNNIEVMSYSRLAADQSIEDCLALCRSNQECYSFNYNKLTKWCYLGTTEETDLLQTKSNKWTAGYRRCVEHISNDPWNNDEFAGGALGTAPTAVTSILVAASTITPNTINFSFTAQTTPGTKADGTASSIASYKVRCSPTTGSSTYPAVTKSYPTTAGILTCGSATATTGCSFGGLAATVSYTCAVTPINTEGMEGPASSSSVVTVL